MSVTGAIQVDNTAITTDSFTWNLTLPAVGKYFIQARWPANATRSTSATYTAVGSDGASSRAFNQQVNNNAWVNIGVKTNHAVNNVLTVKLATSATGTVAADMVRAVPYQVTSTNLHYVFTDHIDTPRVITRASDNQMVWRWDNTDPFGVIQPNANPAGLGNFTYNPRFPGQVYDVETNLNYNYHRSYDSNIGSYTSSDPIGLAGGWNTYTYVGGNPVNDVDPTGESSLTLGGASGLAGGEATSSGLGAMLGAGARAALGPLGVIAGALTPSTAGEGSDVVPKQCPKDDCDLTNDEGMTNVLKTRAQKLGQRSYACVYRRKGLMFTFPQWIDKDCYPINYEICMVDTSTMDRALYGYDK